jgi:two-component system sensor histidine kinase PilS (NtrC family)
MFITSFITHVTAFYLSAFLSGQLADLWHRAEATAEKAQIELVAQEHMASLGKLSAAMAHEIRNPLAAISGCVELLVETPDLETQTKLKGIILREVHRLNNLIEEFLIYSRPMPPRLFRTDICALTRETCDVIKTHDVAQMHNIDVVAPERLEASVDAGQIRQMLWNLLKNALEASPKDAPVQISLATSNKQQIILEIHDNGAGISPEMRQFLFEPFHTTKPQGTGLGLAVVKRIVDGHGGDIRFISQEGNGTTARVILPVSLS